MCSSDLRGSVIGSALSSCTVIKQADPDKGALLEMSIAVGQVNLTDQNGEPLVKLDQWGVQNGWAMWPINFDPTWVKSCKFFTEKEAKVYKVSAGE